MTPTLLAYQIEPGKLGKMQVVCLRLGIRVQAVDPADFGQPIGALAGVLKELGADALICGGIGAGAQKALADEGIKLVAGVSGKVEGAMSGYLNGTLEFRTDFTCNHHHGDHAHGEGHTCGGHGHGEGHSCGGGCKH